MMTQQYVSRIFLHLLNQSPVRKLMYLWLSYFNIHVFMHTTQCHVADLKLTNKSCLGCYHGYLVIVLGFLVQVGVVVLVHEVLGKALERQQAALSEGGIGLVALKIDILKVDHSYPANTVYVCVWTTA